MSMAVQIKGFPCYYITDAGDVYYRDVHRLHTGRIKKMKLEIARNGYNRISIYDENKNSNISVCCSGRRKTAGGYEWAYKQ